jgi:hypothetical protein
MIRKRGKKGAMEMSMGTIVVLVIAMTMLVLGIIFVKNIFFTASTSLDAIDGQVKKQIQELFPNEDDYVLIYPNENSIKIRAGTDDFGVGIFARTPGGDTVNLDTFRYKLSLDTSSVGNCVEEIGMKKTEELFNKKFGVYNRFNKYQDDSAGAKIIVSIPEATKLCNQDVEVELFDGESGIAAQPFTIQITRKGLF